MPAGLGGGGWMAISLEAVMGTYQDPSTVGTVWVPILSEDLRYREDKYYSPQIRQQTIVSAVVQAPYSVSGDIRMEADPQFLPYFMHCSRHTIAKTGTGPYVYTYRPGSQGSASTAASGAVPRTASVTIVRNGVGFGYAGVVFGGYEYTIDNGVEIVTFNALGLSESLPVALGTPAWVDPQILGAAAHNVYLDTAGTAPAFAGGNNVNFDGFTFTVNFNAAAQNRIRRDRAASYISYGETDARFTTRLDFLDRTDYDHMKAADTLAARLESIYDGVSFSAATAGVQITANRAVYDEYNINLGGMADLIMADTTARVIGIAGGSAYTIAIKSAASIA